MFERQMKHLREVTQRLGGSISTMKAREEDAPTTSSSRLLIENTPNADRVISVLKH